MKKIIFLLVTLFIFAVGFTVPQAAESEYDTNVFKEQTAKIETEQQALNQRIIATEELLQNDIKRLEGSIAKLQQQITKEKKDFSKELASLKQSFEDNFANHQKLIDTQQEQLLSQAKNIQDTSELLQKVIAQLESKIINSEQNTNQKIGQLSVSLSNNTLYWIIAVVIIAILTVVLFIFLKTQLQKEKTGLTENIRNTKLALEEEGVKLDTKLIALLETQLKLLEGHKSTNQQNDDEPDHTLALKVADEIIRIQRNLSNMDSDTKGLKQLAASVKRIQDNFEANGYELVEMLGKRYDQGMKASATMKPDPNLHGGEEIITRIIKPQVNFKGVMIQSAQIEVSVAE